MARTIWNDVLERIQTKVNNYTYQTWFEPTSLFQDTGSTLVIQVARPDGRRMDDEALHRVDRRSAR